jgi:hypothetical protein
MQLSGLVITHQLSAQGAGWLAKVASVVDELVAVVAEERAHPDVYSRLEGIGARIRRVQWPTFYPSDDDSRQMIAACAGDWILKVDHDEELSPEWFDPEWRQILERDFTHCWLPRRWILPSGDFLECEPWWPDWQLRLFRNAPDEMTFPTELHESMQMTGRSAYLRTLAIHHHDLWMAPRSAREQKAQTYERLRPEKGLGYFYLYEDCGSVESPLPQTSDFDLAAEELRMEALPLEQLHALSLRPEAPPTRMKGGELLWLPVTVVNRTTRELAPGLPYPIHIAYHWLAYPSREMAVFDGMRTRIFPALPPGETRELRMFIIAPRDPGEYVLQLTMVQEHLRWLEAEAPDLVQEFRIAVHD